MKKKQEHPDSRITVNAAELLNLISEAVEKKQHHINSVRINASELDTWVKAAAPIKCFSFDCLYSAPEQSCFLNCVELEKGICRYYRSVPYEQRHLDRKDLPGGYNSFMNSLRRAESDKG